MNGLLGYFLSSITNCYLIEQTHINMYKTNDLLNWNEKSECFIILWLNISCTFVKLKNYKCYFIS